ncbi:hypothetical protein CLAFUW4_09549 [Fulvia fulva]|uniref:Uncharacterized protein n=1 Tax=Passalora fulva TaxID=5499 RepID=A0A9Q8UTL7_PASFU|nr:uncharacterized protein CLAFUR5_09644 [Fulvia fulva]KAK4613879.1 hypothetical protein CLAFUR4_09555 [Fulvia fulva]KAK4614924.1 hypothetical protein CLAFUR0_09546 [Fulvia fulva]UJO22059.1 hypothetical protein CLAFUR5_09644 [Fulvia fulva]WPV20651.1 hypothetical protein CLAFUW4_09549 [Fulvia fulva]WPV34899.1 hypothetical protein CLAFUW7_09550 [Fulvia fulva]
MLDLSEADAPDVIVHKKAKSCDCFAQALRPLGMPIGRGVREVMYTIDDDQEKKVASIQQIGDFEWSEDAVPDLFKWQKLTREAEVCAELGVALGDAMSILPNCTREQLQAASRALDDSRSMLDTRQPCFMGEEEGKMIVAEIEKLEAAMQGLTAADLKRQAHTALQETQARIQKFCEIAERLSEDFV